MYVHRMASKSILIYRMQDLLRIQKTASLSTHPILSPLPSLSRSSSLTDLFVLTYITSVCAFISEQSATGRITLFITRLRIHSRHRDQQVQLTSLSNIMPTTLELLMPKIALASLPLHSRYCSCLTRLLLQREFRDRTLFGQLI